jgi:hypothetical protein
VTTCARTEEILVLASRGEPEPDEVRGHALTCEACREALAGARRAGEALRAWADPEPPADLLARTLARIAVANVASDPAPHAPAPAAAPAPARRRAAEVLASPIPGLAPRRGRPGVRVLLQALAASVLFLASAGLVAAFYPGVMEAMRDDNERLCQEHLKRIAAALRRYRELHPEATVDSTEKRGRRLRDALVLAGLASRADFHCPGMRAGRVDADLGYVLKLPASLDKDSREPVAWDCFDNHRPIVHVAYSDGSIAELDELELSKSLFELVRSRKSD